MDNTMDNTMANDEPDSQSQTISRTNSHTTSQLSSQRSWGTSTGSRLRLLRRAVRGACFTNAEDDLERLPSDIRDLFTRIRLYTMSRSIMPLALRSQYRIFSSLPVTSGVFYDSSPCHRTTLGADPTTRELNTIAGSTADCLLRHDDEAGWNSLAHAPLLLLAQALSPHGHRLGSVNLTHARPLARLLPAPNLSGEMAGFGIVLKGSAALDAAARGLARESDDDVTLNHTDHDPVALEPIAVSIETRRHGGGSTAPELQLRVWAACHLARLAELRKRPVPAGGETVCLPLMFVVGAKWEFMLARGEYDARGALKETVVYESYYLGDTTNVEGVLVVLAVVLELMAWSEKVWRPWFEALVTPA